MNEIYHSSLTYSIWSEWLLLSFLILAGMVYWTISKRIGFQILYLTTLSLSFGFIITMYFPFLYAEDQHLPLTHPHIQASMTLFSFFIPLVRRRIEVLLCLFPPFVISLSYLFLQESSVFSVVGGILIGGFISYMFYRSLDWMGSMPEPYLFAFAIILPVFIGGLIYPNTSFLLLPGLLLGAGIGVTFEQYKIRMSVSHSNISKLLSLILGTSGMIMGYLIFIVSPISFPFLFLIVGILGGIWITFFVPTLLILTKIYEQQGKSREIF
ncbi:hypothetical protein [Salipaludibacillus daqingensis]|uniref:hypothetical protein n=1 Tax=Salipaludibacillus daqingensis TaxID=3041001 RepID=UPI002475A91B|nr:hypothetical protein [Salipaludibacillus daqingensis]